MSIYCSALSSEMEAILNRNFETALSVEEAVWGRARIGIIGEGRAGKTSLVNALTGTPSSDIKSTVGIVQSIVSVSQISARQADWTASQEIDKLVEANLAKHIIALQEEDRKPSSTAIPLSTAASNVTLEKALVTEHGSMGKSPSFDAFGGGSPSKQINPRPKKYEVKAVRAVAREDVLKFITQFKAGFGLSITIIDYGGQSCFFPLHHLAITDKALYIIVFNMELLVSPNEVVKLEALNYLRSWVDTVTHNIDPAYISLGI